MKTERLLNASQSLLQEWEHNLRSADIVGSADYVKGVLFGLTLMLNEIRKEAGWKNRPARDPRDVAQLK